MASTLDGYTQTGLEIVKRIDRAGSEGGRGEMVELTLPYRTDWREIEAVLDYCKGKGADRGTLDARFGSGEGLRETLNALEQLALAERDESGDVRLTDLGDRLAYAPDAPTRRGVLLEALLAYRPYRVPLERAAADRLTLLDGPWVEHVWQVDMRLGQPRNRVEEARTMFFRLADAAGLGAYRRGVRGQTTRLELVEDFAQHVAPLLDLPAVVVQPVVPPASVEPEPQTATALSVSPAVGAPVGTTLSIQVDLTDWEIEKIEALFRLIGYAPPE